MFRLLWETGVRSFAAIYVIYLASTFFLDHFGSLASEAQVAVSVVMALFVVVLIENTYLHLRGHRDKRYAQCFEVITEGFSKIHQLERAQQGRSPGDLYDGTKAVVDACEFLCVKTARAFDLITATHCSVCIKILGRDEASGKLYAHTLARDSNSHRNTSQTTLHLIEENTDFLFIFENIDRPKGRLFISNQLPLLANYRNSSFKLYEPPSYNLLMRWWRWPLPYRSALVVPICPCGNAEQETLIGFLCVDSKAGGAFVTNYDFELLAGIADGLYNVLSPLISVERTPAPVVDAAA